MSDCKDDKYCNALCGCAGTRLAKECGFLPSCSKCRVWAAETGKKVDQKSK